MTKKKHYSQSEKTMILREHIEEHVPISEIAEKYGIHINSIYTWKKNMYEVASGNANKQQTRNERKQSKLLDEIDELKARLAQRESLIAELVEDNIKIKKNGNGEIYASNGLNRR
jgi:transposase-like protein